MLIGIDASRAVRAERTGTENYSLFLIRALLRLSGEHRFRLYFCQPPTEGVFRQDEQVQWRIMPWPRLWTHLRLSWEMAWHPPDVLFVPSHVLPLVCPRRSVVTAHDLGYLHYPQAHSRWSRWYLDWSTRHSVRRAQVVLADSVATKLDLGAMYGVPAERIVVAYPAGAEGLTRVTDEALLQRVRRRYSTGQRYILYVGTIQPRKNLATLIGAFGRLVREGGLQDDVRLVLAGRPGWRSDDVARLARQRELSGRVVMPGYIAQADLPALLSGALAYVLPSWYEGFGLPVLEAMACEAPVICSRAASLPEVAGDAAILFDPASEDELTQALRRVCADESLRQELARRGKERACAFTWERCAQQVLETLQKVAAARAEVRGHYPVPDGRPIGPPT